MHRDDASKWPKLEWNQKPSVGLPTNFNPGISTVHVYCAQSKSIIKTKCFTDKQLSQQVVNTDCKKKVNEQVQLRLCEKVV